MDTGAGGTYIGVMKTSSKTTRDGGRGQFVSSRLFGPCSRFKLIRFRSRFGTDTFFVEDAEKTDRVTGLPSVIRQADSEAEAVAGLDTEAEDIR